MIYQTKLAGVSYRQHVITLLRGAEVIEVRPEPDNAFDRNALAVFATIDGSQVQCGYIPAPLAGIAAPKLAGRSAEGKIVELTGGTDKYPTRGAVVIFEVPDRAVEQDGDETLHLGGKYDPR